MRNDRSWFPYCPDVVRSQSRVGCALWPCWSGPLAVSAQRPASVGYTWRGWSLWLGSEQTNAERNHRDSKNNCSNVDQGDRSAGLSCGRGKHGEEESRRNQNGSERHPNSNEPEEGNR